MGIEMERFETSSQHGAAVQELYRQNPARQRGLAVLLPGQAYSCQRPLLHFARLASLQAGLDVLCLEFGFQAARRPGPQGDLVGVFDEAREAISRAIAMTGPVPALTLVAKSLGTLVAGEVLRGGDLPRARAMLLTPVDRAVFVLEEFSATAVIGTADRFYEREAVQRSMAARPHAWHVLDGLDHGLERPGDVAGSLAGLAEATRILGAFLAES